MTTIDPPQLGRVDEFLQRSTTNEPTTSPNFAQRSSSISSRSPIADRDRTRSRVPPPAPSPPTSRPPPVPSPPTRSRRYSRSPGQSTAPYHGTFNAMASTFEENEARDQWLFTEYEILHSPSVVKDGLLPAEESVRRAKGVNFIIQAGIILKLPQMTLGTAAVFFHRFYMRHSMAAEKNTGGIHHYVSHFRILRCAAVNVSLSKLRTTEYCSHGPLPCQ